MVGERPVFQELHQFVGVLEVEGGLQNLGDHHGLAGEKVKDGPAVIVFSNVVTLRHEPITELISDADVTTAKALGQRTGPN